ncbi:MAG TPA: aminotransferase class I/II-fold pyridoxal phosphate-dependent enzyme [Polyangiaceae bacterium]|nr:aminotransferase class I/II-fold pyridoxal phosphate-dependent enzyme [Polyangiaceae bacterium]
MKAIILSAGYGNRMRPLTDGRHKTLLTVGGKTIIDRIVEGLVAAGVHEMLVVTGYRADELEAHLLGAHPAVKFVFVRNERYRETNNIFSLSLAFARESFDQDIVLVESDLVCEPAVFERIVKTPHENAALLARYQTGLDGTVVTIADGIVTGVIPPHLQANDFSFADKYKTLNIYKFSRDFCRKTFRQLLTYYAQTIDDNCYYELVLGILIYLKKATIGAELIETEKWSEVDDPNDLRIAEMTFNPAGKRKLLEETAGGYWSVDVTDFSYLRNVHFPNSSMLAELKNNLPKLLWNYGSRQSILNEKLALFLLCRSERVTALNGASQSYPFLAARFAGKRALLPAPTFGEYPRTFPGALTYADAVGIDVREVEQRAEKADVVVFVNPNNPTGSLVPTAFIHDFARRHPMKTVLVDESFLAFSDERSIVAFLEEEPLDNVLVVVSLSKTLGIPGARLGYVYASDAAFNRDLARALPIWNMNSIAEHVLEIVLKHRTSLAESFRATAVDRELFAALLEKTPAVERVHRGGGNFVLARLRREFGSAASVATRLLERHGLYVKDVSEKFGNEGNHLRLAVRSQSENRTLVAALGSFVPR